MSIRRRLIGVLCFSAAACFAIPAVASPPHLLVYTPEGALLHRIEAGPHAAVDQLARARVDAFGRVVAQSQEGYAAGGAFLSDGADAVAAWDALFPLTPPPPPQTSDAHRPPMFDSAGNAWVFNTHIQQGAYSLQVRVSDGATGAWGDWSTIAGSGTRYVANAEAALDNDGNITVVFRDINSGYHLYAVRYAPGSGWSAPQRIYSTGAFFQAIRVAADEHGNVVALFDEDRGDETAQAMLYDAATGTWSGPQQLSAPGAVVRLMTLLAGPQNRDVTFVYLVAGGGAPGLVAHRWNSATQTWGPAEALPGSEIASYNIATAGSRLPGVVDRAGVVTLFWGAPFVPYANRNDGGTWQPAVQLLSAEIDDVENFAGAALSPLDDVFGIMGRYEAGVNYLHTFLYDAGSGWQPAQTAYTSFENISTRVRVAFYQGRRAVATVLGAQQGIRQLTSVLYDGERWGSAVVDIPEEHQAFYSDLAPNRGTVLLVYEAERSGNQGIQSTWLRAGLPGDLNCDGFVDNEDIDPFVLAITDPAGYAAGWPHCDIMNGDINGDGFVDNEDIDPFVALITAN